MYYHPVPVGGSNSIDTLLYLYLLPLRGAWQCFVCARVNSMWSAIFCHQLICNRILRYFYNCFYLDFFPCGCFPLYQWINHFPEKNKLEAMAAAFYLPEVILDIQLDKLCDALIA